MAETFTHLEGDALISIKSVCQKTGLGTTSVYELMKRGQFPRSIALTARCVRWSRNEINDWIEEKKAQRDAL